MFETVRGVANFRGKITTVAIYHPGVLPLFKAVSVFM